MKRTGGSIRCGVGFVAALAAFSVGCTGDLVANLTETKSGSVTLYFINNTPYRASFACGTYDALDRNPPGEVDFHQLLVEANTTTTPLTLACGRNAAVGTAALIARATDTGEPDSSGFDPDIFTPLVAFSSTAQDDPGAALPDAGTADGIEVRLGVDYACGDVLYFTFPSVETRVKRIVADLLEVAEEAITRDTPLDPNSLDRIELTQELEQEFDINIPDAEANGIQNVGEAIDYIEGRTHRFRIEFHLLHRDENVP
jgi:acyl carrier protein